MKKKRSFFKEERRKKEKVRSKDIMFELEDWKETSREYDHRGGLNVVTIYSRRIKGTGHVVVQIKVDSIGSTTRYWVRYYHKNIKKFGNKYEESVHKSKLDYEYGREERSVDLLKLEATIKLNGLFLIKKI